VSYPSETTKNWFKEHFGVKKREEKMHRMYPQGAINPDTNLPYANTFFGGGLSQRTMQPAPAPPPLPHYPAAPQPHDPASWIPPPPPPQQVPQVPPQVPLVPPPIPTAAAPVVYGQPPAQAYAAYAHTGPTGPPGEEGLEGLPGRGISDVAIEGTQMHIEFSDGSTKVIDMDILQEFDKRLRLLEDHTKEE
jgi:hypothetical protein